MNNSIIGNYKLSTMIGSGGFGKVYACSHILNKKIYALKIDEKSNTIKYEASILKYLNKVPNVIKLQHYGTHNNKQYMVMDLHRLTLEEHLLTNNVSKMEKINYSLQILEVLKAIHQKGILHRDIKPENFLMTMDGSKIILIDFGMAKIYLNSDKSHKPFKKTGDIIGSLHYCSINSHDCYELSRRDDIASFVYVSMFMFQKTLPWEKTNDVHRKNEMIKLKKKHLLKMDPVDTIFKKHLHILNYAYGLDYDAKPNYSLIEIHINNIMENI